MSFPPPFSKLEQIKIIMGMEGMDSQGIFFLKTTSELASETKLSLSAALWCLPREVKRADHAALRHLENKVQTPQQAGRGSQSYLPPFLINSPTQGLASWSFNMLHIFISPSLLE